MMKKPKKKTQKKDKPKDQIDLAHSDPLSGYDSDSDDNDNKPTKSSKK